MDTETMLLLSEFGREVAVLRWPEQEDERETLARLGLPRLLVVDAASEPPPPSASCLEDWARLPIEPQDLNVRLRTLAARSRLHGAVPRLDPLGQLWHRGKFVSLSPTEERLATALIGRFGEVVPDDDLLEAGWAQGEATVGALRIHLTRLRRRLRPLGLLVKSRRGVGHVMNDAASEGVSIST